MCYIVNDKDLSQQAKEQLSQIKKTDRLIERLQATVATLRSSLTSQSYELKPDRVQTSGPTDQMAATFARIDDLERKINARIDDLIKLKEDTLKVIERISDKDQQNVLIARYVQGVRWEKIAVDLNFSIRQVHRIHGAALLSFAKELKDGTL